MIVAALLASYLLGSIPFGLLVARAAAGKDVRAVGSGNIGATNVARAAGRGAAAATLVLDALKGYVPAMVAGRSFEWAWDARNPKLRLTQLVMKTGADTYLGSAEMEDNGQLVLKVSDGTRHIQAAGAILRGDLLKPVTP